MNLPNTCPECGREDFGNAKICTECGHRMMSPARVRVAGWFMMVLSVVLTGFTVWLLVWTFASGRKSPEFAGKVFMGLFCAAVFAANVAFFAAGRSQVIHGRWTQFALWVNRWLVGPE